MKELIDFGLVRKEYHSEGKEFKHNVYHLTPQNEWVTPEEAVNSCNVRKGRQGLKRGVANGDNHPVNGDNQGGWSTGITTLVNGDSLPRLTGITTPVNPTVPKGNSIEGNSIEGNSIEGDRSPKRDLTTPSNLIESRAVAREAIEINGVRTDLIQPEVVETLAVSPDLKSSLTGQVENGLKGTIVPTSRRKQKKQKSSPDRRPEAFEQFWEVYRGFCLEVGSEAGRRTEAVVAWDALLLEDCLEALQEGTAYYVEIKHEQFLRKGEAIGVSHACRYLRDRKWQDALDYKRRQVNSSPLSSADRRAMQTYESAMAAIANL
ncbi:hypothetical protein H6F43_04255 [Leptolyngbya sp. FACHB-36]|uniref:hypothetical protein n=1 Tax=Leptolyngbya sp. FACHB-36 TaxID=2692808 RepID=UPI001680DB5B|nr:hypothetical protein [Leptolyngbya sp. FACHB-36]MBD2019396.1 hypothetical protein [Leptolyngbya sp. FACHB-36]